ncbi:MAG: cation diffusion facilitator family transporter [Candidatus Micrarchaeota archaeon]|nr:cation diffusion facilitator family transporter [Candidatus Micrarchaeota archaeon]
MKEEKTKEKKIVSLLNLAGNVFLFLIKIFIGFLTGSVALIADSLNSLSDIFSSSLALIAVKISDKKPDEGHPFGHQRIESIAGLIIGILVAVIGVETAKEGLMKLFFGNEIRFGLAALIVLAITIALKLFLAFYTKRIAEKTKSMALHAVSQDSRMDVLISITALIGVFGAVNGFPFLDPLMALVISVYIVWTGIKIALENSNLLIGKAPKKELIEEIKRKALEVEGVKGVHDVRAQHLGVLVQVEVHIELNEKLSVQQAHSIGKNVQYALEAMKEIDRAFIHLDPFKAVYFWNNEKLSGKK